ncbi:hypothetical protein CDEST_05351 [Colletotrichum destructivum]|uniref:Uncharacterized protein n=1 Tax=Colletotrichum destructivum TaxID=34406 RepID=A0AAX4IAA4_9PEZI|nr:hypothetical protein CDEST_05351 [Colletotrichum destructivum]
MSAPGREAAFSPWSASSQSSNGPGTTVPPPFVAPTAGVMVNGTLKLRSGLYTKGDFVTPAGATCRAISESWIL